MRQRRRLFQLAQLLSGRVPARPDWDELMLLAGEQLIVPQLLSRLGAASEDLPDEVHAYLHETRRRSLQRNQALYVTLSDAVRTLNEAGIEPVLLKGAAFWATPAGPADRLISDLDLLVAPAEMTAAVQALVACGFAILKDARNSSDHPIVELGRGCDPGPIDLHQYAPAMNTRISAALKAHTRRVSVAGGTAQVLTPEAQIFVLAIHDQVHDVHFWRGGYNLRHLLDIAVLSKTGVDWDAIIALCQTRTERIALGALLQAVNTLVGADIPNHLLSLWTRAHFWRQCVQFRWPILTVWFDAVRMFRAKLEGRVAIPVSDWR